MTDTGKMAISCGAKLDCRSRGTSIAILPVSVITVFRPVNRRPIGTPNARATGTPLRWAGGCPGSP